MTRKIERGISWPEGRRLTRAGWQKPISLDKFLKREGISLDSTIPPDDFRILRRFYRLRLGVDRSEVAPTVVARRFERRLKKKGKSEEFYHKYGDILRLISSKTGQSK